MKSKIKKLICILAAAVLALSMTAPVFAGSGEIDMNEPGKITAEYYATVGNQKVPLEGIEVRLYKVAAIEGTTAPNAASGYTVRFSLEGDLQQLEELEEELNNSLVIIPGEGVDERGEKWQSLAATFQQYLLLFGSEGIGVKETDAFGKVEYDNLEPGLYLLLTLGSRVGEYTYTSQPSWVVLPQFDKNRGEWTYQLDVSPKFSSGTETPTENPDVPAVYKKILENNESGYAGRWGDGADYDIGDDIPYRLIGTVPDLSKHSGNYYYRFNDSMVDTLKFDPSSVHVYLFTPSDAVDDYAVETAAHLSSMGTYTELTSGFSLAKNSTDTAFQVIFSNLKDVVGITNGGTSKGKYIIVEFTASIQPNADVGSTIGNANEVTLTYSSPSGTRSSTFGSAASSEMPDKRTFRLLGSTPGWGNIDDTVTPTGTETTEKDEVVAYTWKLPVLKVDEDEEPLPDTEFLVLYAPSADLIETVRNAAMAFAGRSDENPISDEDKDYVLKVNRVSDGTYRPNGYFSRANNDNLENAAVMVTGENGQINITGVDQGYYFLVEYKAPTGFQRLFDPVYVHVTPEHIYDNADPFERTDTYVDGHEPDATGDQLSAYYIYTDKNNDGKCTADETVDKVAITNSRKGGSLPSTGGIGTTGIYIAGITLMSGAALIMIIRRKRKAG